MAPRLAITGPRPDISRPASANNIATLELAATEPLAAPLPPRRWRPWGWAAAVLLHVAVILALLLLARRPPPEEQSPPGVSVVFENGGAPQSASPVAPRPGPPTPQQAPPPAAPPPPQTAEAEPEVNLNMPEMPLATIQSAPQPQPQPQPPAPPRPQPHPAHRAPPQKYVVMNNMSYGNPSPPVPQARRGLNLSLAQSDAEAVNAPELSIHGDVGADWDAELNKWVNDHKYYPQAAIEQNQQGDVEIEFTVDRAGKVTGVHLLGSSGSPFLDQAWLTLFADNRLPPFPPGSRSKHITVDATMHYELID